MGIIIVLVITLLCIPAVRNEIWLALSPTAHRIQKIRSDYLEARKKALNERKVVKFSQLPVFPTRVPYGIDHGAEKEIWGTHVRGIKWEEFVDKCCREMRGLTDRVMLMRGDYHLYADARNHVLLVIDEVEQSENELAIAALVISDEGYSASVSVRQSCWPRSIFKRDGVGYYDTDRNYRKFIRVFGAPGWAHGRQVEIDGRFNRVDRPYDTVEFTPVFSDDTERRASDVATMLKGAVERVIRS